MRMNEAAMQIFVGNYTTGGMKNKSLSLPNQLRRPRFLSRLTILRHVL